MSITKETKKKMRSTIDAHPITSVNTSIMILHTMFGYDK